MAAVETISPLPDAVTAAAPRDCASRASGALPSPLHAPIDLAHQPASRPGGRTSPTSSSMTLLDEPCAAAAQTVAMDISAAADIFERIGRLNLIALRARQFSYDESSLSCHVGRSTDIRLVISAETGGYRIDAYRLSERTLHIRHLVHAVSGAGDLTDSLFDALDSLL